MRRAYVGFHPGDPGGGGTEAVPGVVQRCRGEIEDGELVVAGSEQTIDQERRPSTDIDDRG